MCGAGQPELALKVLERALSLTKRGSRRWRSEGARSRARAGILAALAACHKRKIVHELPPTDPRDSRKALIFPQCCTKVPWAEPGPGGSALDQARVSWPTASKPISVSCRPCPRRCSSAAASMLVRMICVHHHHCLVCSSLAYHHQCRGNL